ncbi:MAG: M20/M25/M40 family metallo-hydrolase [Elusimicrobia bacterium]|nr:M20/M25/M40 family metallo-hydrolase [Elusimicrobiota bacterium]
MLKSISGPAFAGLLSCAVFGAWAAGPGAEGKTVSPTLGSEAREHLKALTALDTSNPPGNEAKAVDYLKARLDREGIPATVIAFAQGRSSLIARLKGSQGKRPLLLVCHTDVVPPEPSEWATPPFEPVETGGYLYARGAADNKSMCAAMLSVLTHLKRSGRRMVRDVVFLAHADEESGGAARHLDWLLERQGRELEAEFALMEGGNTVWKDGKVAEIRVQTAEKTYLDVILTSRGSSGHSSIPRQDNAVASLARAVARLSEYRAPAVLTPMVKDFLVRQSSLGDAEVRSAIKAVLQARPNELDAAADGLEAVSVDFAAMLRDTITPTMIKGGYKANVVPSGAEAVLNARLLPGAVPAQFMALLSTVVADPSVTIRAEPTAAPPPGPTPADTELYKAIEEAASVEAPGAPVMPFMAVWTTDAASLRARGVKVYGLDVPLSDDDGSRVHGKNERISLAAFDWYAQFLSSVVEKVAVR